MARKTQAEPYRRGKNISFGRTSGYDKTMKRFYEATIDPVLGASSITKRFYQPKFRRPKKGDRLI